MNKRGFNLAKHHVAAGTFYVGNAEQLLLQAFLGTCVGVALYDAQTGIGGMIHLLLPEPISKESTPFPEKYAATGMPLFIKAVLNAGAQKKHLTASIAGGALVGPIQEQDLSLDIGGRTCEIAKTILEKENIPIKISETGGFFTCCLSLNMSTGETSVTPAGIEKNTDRFVTHKPTQDEILATIDTIKPIPQVALKVLRIINDGNYDIERIAKEVRKDQVISANTIRLANSAIFTKKQKLASLDHALVFLGQNLLVKLVISAAVEGYFTQSNNGYSLCKGGLYYHSLGTAMITEKIAELTNTVHPTYAYTAGLLHDIGKVVLDQLVAARYPLFYRTLNETEADIIKIENKILGTDHTQIGGILAKKWIFPPILANAVTSHHVFDPTKDGSELASMVHLADLLMSRFNTGLELERLDITSLAQHFKQLGLTDKSMAQMIDAIPAEVFKSACEISEQSTVSSS